MSKNTNEYHIVSRIEKNYNFYLLVTNIIHNFRQISFYGINFNRFTQSL